MFPRLILLTVLAALALAGPAAAQATTPSPATKRALPACAGADRQAGPVRTARVVRCLVTRERARRGLRVLRVQPALARAARRHALTMLRTDRFAHTIGASTLGRRLRTARYGGRQAGENLFWGLGSGATPRAVVRAWMTSPAHRANLLAPRWREVGISVRRGTPAGHRGGVTVAAVFGSGR